MQSPPLCNARLDRIRKKDTSNKSQKRGYKIDYELAGPFSWVRPSRQRVSAYSRDFRLGSARVAVQNFSCDWLSTKPNEYGSRIWELRGRTGGTTHAPARCGANCVPGNGGSQVNCERQLIAKKITAWCR